MTTSPFEAGLYAACGLVFFIVFCCILTALRKLKIIAFILIALSIAAEVFIIKNLIMMQTCIKNVNNLKAALVKYEEKNGVFPKKLMDLSPDYLQDIPICPEVGHDTYSASYKSRNEGNDCGFSCSGSNHNLIVQKKNYPTFDSAKDLKERVNVTH